MADKRQIKRTMRRLERVKTWQLIVLCVLAAFIAASFLRLNNVGMLQRRDAVIAADKAGDTQEVENRLYELQAYAADHMNASTGDVYLTGQYDRDSQAIISATSSGTDNSDSDAFHQADASCRAHYISWAIYVQCMTGILDQQTASGNGGVVNVSFPNPDLYRHAYISPLWSPDFAGFSVLLVLVIVLLIIARTGTWLVLKMLLKWRYRHA